MPPKRRTSLGRTTSASRRMAATRAAESSEQTSSRLADQRIRQAASRATETQGQGQARRDEDRTRRVVSRAAKNPEQTSSRVAGQRTRQAASRAVETQEEAQARREEDCARHAISRAAESTERTSSRLADQRTRQAASRATETQEQGQARRDEDRVRHAVSRADENPEQRRSRSEDQRRRQAASRAAQWTFMEGEAFRYDSTKSYDSHPQLSIGRMTDVCAHCEAYKWPREVPGMCCSNGKVKLTPLRPPPEPLEPLMSGTTSESKHFLENIRQYNSCFQMTSFGASEKVFESGFMPTFEVQGQVYHCVGCLLPSFDEEPKFLQIYFMGDDRKQPDRRCNTNPGTRRDIVLKLQQMLHQYNNYVHSFKIALERMPSDEYKVIIKADKTPVGEHARRFNEPLVNEVAVVIVGNEFNKRDIVLEKKNS